MRAWKFSLVRSAILFCLCIAALAVSAAPIFTEEEISASYNPRHVDIPPRSIKRPPPEIPWELKDHKAMVQVAFIINEEGKVISPRVVKSTNYSFDEIAMETVSMWTFKPAVKDGEPVAVRLIAPLSFK